MINSLLAGQTINYANIHPPDWMLALQPKQLALIKWISVCVFVSLFTSITLILIAKYARYLLKYAIMFYTGCLSFAAVFYAISHFTESEGIYKLFTLFYTMLMSPILNLVTAVLSITEHSDN